MIIPSQAMLVSETVYKDGEPAAPDSITAILYRIVSGSRSASGVTVTLSTTANTGEYTFSWTNDAGWNRTDDLELKAIPVIGGKSYPMVVWRSHGHVDAVMRGTDDAALPGDVSPTINFNPTINPTPVTVNPTTLDPATVAAIQDGLATQTSLDSVVAVTDKLGVMIEDDGAGGWTYTVSALGNVPSVDTVEVADAVVDRLSDTVILAQPVSTKGQITSPVLIGDDYLRANDRDFRWTVKAVPGVSVDDASCVFALTSVSGARFSTNGLVTDLGDGEWGLSIEIAAGDLEGLGPGEHAWSVGVVDQTGAQITAVMSDCRKKATVAYSPAWQD